MKVASAQIPSREIVRLNSNNTVLLRGEITEASVLDVSLDLAKVVAKRGFKLHPIYLVIDSPGGEIDAGIAFVEFAKIVPNLRTITIFAASMAAFTVEGLPGNRLITNNGVLMFHRARGQISGQIEVGELETRLAFTKKQILGMENVSAARLGLNIFQYKANVKLLTRLSIFLVLKN
jgi:ATP-dependent protease ClpP protease subunit